MVYRHCHRRTWLPAQPRRARIEHVRRGPPIRGAREAKPRRRAARPDTGHHFRGHRRRRPALPRARCCLAGMDHAAPAGMEGTEGIAVQPKTDAGWAKTSQT